MPGSRKGLLLTTHIFFSNFFLHSLECRGCFRYFYHRTNITKNESWTICIKKPLSAFIFKHDFLSNQMNIINNVTKASSFFVFFAFSFACMKTGVAVNLIVKFLHYTWIRGYTSKTNFGTTLWVTVMVMQQFEAGLKRNFWIFLFNAKKCFRLRWCKLLDWSKKLNLRTNLMSWGFAPFSYQQHF